MDAKRTDNCNELIKHVLALPEDDSLREVLLAYAEQAEQERRLAQKQAAGGGSTIAPTADLLDKVPEFQGGNICATASYRPSRVFIVPDFTASRNAY